jgi:hypothetical protein
MAKNSAARWLLPCALLTFTSLCVLGADVPGNLLTNGGFEAGMQIWKGDGKIVLLPEGNRVCAIEASKSRMKEIKQEFHLKQLQQVEVVFRARSMKYTGPGLRISIHQVGGGSMIWNKQLAEDGSWREYRILYTRASANGDARELNIATLLGTGIVQIDDVEAREPSKVAENQPPEPAPPAATPTPTSKPLPPVAIVKPPAPPIPSVQSKPVPPPAQPNVPPGTFGSLEEIMKAIPGDMIRKLQTAETTDASIAEINDFLKQNVKNKPAQLRIHIAAGETPPNGANKYRIRAIDQPAMTWNGGGANGHVWVYFPESNVPPESKVALGTDIIVSGLLGRCDITNKGRIQLNVDLEKSKLESP